MGNSPGIDGQQFTITLDQAYWNPRDILITNGFSITALSFKQEIKNNSMIKRMNPQHKIKSTWRSKKD